MGPSAKTSTSPILIVTSLDQIGYEAGRALQEQLATEVQNHPQSSQLLLLEHPHTYTFGRRGKAENLLWDVLELEGRGVDVQWVDRGGDVTYHGPGQLVGYPLFALGKVNDDGHLPQADYVGFIRNLEQALIMALAEFGLMSSQIAGLTGVWIQPDVAARSNLCPPAARTQPSKIAAIGVKVDTHGVTRHGFALNINPDMSYWDGIIACGLADRPSISMAQLFESPPPRSEVQRAVIRAFQQVFKFSEVRYGHSSSREELNDD